MEVETTISVMYSLGNWNLEAYPFTDAAREETPLNSAALASA